MLSHVSVLVKHCLELPVLTESFLSILANSCMTSQEATTLIQRPLWFKSNESVISRWRWKILKVELQDRNSFNKIGNWMSIKMRLKCMPWGMSRKIGTLEQELVATKEQNADISCWCRSSKCNPRRQLLKQNCMTCLQNWRLVSMLVKAEAATSLLRTIQNHTNTD